MSPAEKELIALRHSVKSALAGFEAIVKSYEDETLDDYQQGKLSAYIMSVDALRRIDKTEEAVEALPDGRKK